jgi:uncharacterized Fe-S cluster-containing protein
MSENASVRPGEFVKDGRDEAKVIEVAHGMVVIEYVSDGKQNRLQSNRFVRRDGEVCVV